MQTYSIVQECLCPVSFVAAVSTAASVLKALESELQTSPVSASQHLP